MHDFFIYILTNRNRKVLYVGMTNDIQRRLAEHRAKEVPGFSSHYNLSKLLHVEVYPDARSAIAREKQLKGWRREKKVALIHANNRTWRDLSADWDEYRT